MPLPKQTGPAQARSDAGSSELNPDPADGKSGQTGDSASKSRQIDRAKTPGTGALPEPQPGDEVDPGTG
jgi:hypothetical protein